MHNPLPVVTQTPIQTATAIETTADSGLLQPVTAAGSSGFSEMLSGSELSPQLMEMLRSRLSAEEFASLEEMLIDGKELPLAAIFSVLGVDGKDIGLPASSFAQVDLSPAVNSVVGEGVLKQPAKRSEQHPQLLFRAENGQQSAPELPRDSAVTQAKLELPMVVPQPLAPPRVGPSMVDMVSNLAAHMDANGVGISPPANSSSTFMANSSPVSLPQAVTIPPGERGWDQAMGERILWMVGREVQSASVRIRPPNLGPLNIQISIKNDQANINFTAQHGIVKEALEAAIPRLRDMLAESNIQLVNVDVSQRESSARSDFSDPYQQQQDEDVGVALIAADVDESQGVVDADELVNYYRSDHLLDYYA